jgi:orotate phosphoribosyltransferase
MNKETVLDLFRASGALLEGHFRLTSGLHSNGYLQCALVLQHPAHAEKLGAALADKTRALNVGLVVSPALGGLIIGHEVARGLGVRAIFAERQEGMLTLRRGFTIAPGERVLVVEDVLTTGATANAASRALIRGGASAVDVLAFARVVVES